MNTIPLSPMSTAPRDPKIKVIAFPAWQKTSVLVYWSKSSALWCGYYSGRDYNEDELLGWLPLPTLNKSGQAVFEVHP